MVHAGTEKKRKLAAIRARVTNRRAILALLFFVTVVFAFLEFKKEAWALYNISDLRGVADQANGGRTGLLHSVDYLRPDYKVVQKKGQYHTLLPCDGRPYHEWQARVFYYWFKRIKESKSPKVRRGGEMTVCLTLVVDLLIDTRFARPSHDPRMIRTRNN